MSLKSVIFICLCVDVWVSGTDKNHEDCWVWATPVISRVDEAVWASDEPNNSGGNENCMDLKETGYWYINDDPCTSEYMYLCKRDVLSTNLMQPTLDEVNETTLC